VPCLSFSKPKQISLFGPIDGDLGRQSHQLLRRELRLILAIDDGSDDIGRQRRKSQKARQVADGKSLVAGYSRHSQIGVLHQPSLKVMRSSNDAEQSWIGCRLALQEVLKSNINNHAAVGERGGGINLNNLYER
jgi:hypothetical protein